jgi:hypothetical protein
VRPVINAVLCPKEVTSRAIKFILVITCGGVFQRQIKSLWVHVLVKPNRRSKFQLHRKHGEPMFWQLDGVFEH